MAKLQVFIMEAKYCPMCGKPLFGKKYLEKHRDCNPLTEPYTYVYKCRRCKSVIIIETSSKENHPLMKEGLIKSKA